MKISVLIGLLFVVYSSHSQRALNYNYSKNNNYVECVTKDLTPDEYLKLPYYGNEVALQNMIDRYEAYKSDNSSSRSNDFFRIPIVFWHYFNNDLTLNEPTPVEFQAAVDEINRIYSQNGLPFYFYIKCIQEIERNNLENIGPLDAVVQLAGFADLSAVNIHILSNNWDANFYSPITDAIYVERGRFVTEAGRQTFPHEVGHYFGLSHTHAFHNFSLLSEPVSRNWAWRIGLGFPPTFQIKHCSWTGDFLCDTPADPNMSIDIDLLDQDGDGDNDLYSSTNDIWIGSVPNRYIGNSIQVQILNGNSPVLDDFGDSYVPHEQNIMSYANRPWRNNLTIGQRAVIIDNLEKRIMSEIWRSNRNGFPLSSHGDDFETDDSEFLARPISFNEIESHNFHQNLIAGVPNTPICSSDESDWFRLTQESVFGSIKLRFVEINGQTIPIDPNAIQILEQTADWPSPTFTDIVNLASITSTNSVIEIDFPCGLNSARRIFVGVSPRENLVSRNYTARLSVVEDVLVMNAGDQVCLNQVIDIENLPPDASVTWTDITLGPSELILSNYNGSQTSIVDFIGSPSSEFRLRATITSGDCTHTIRHTFEAGVSSLTSVGQITFQKTGPPCEPDYSFRIIADGETSIDWNCSSPNPEFGGCTQTNPDLFAFFLPFTSDGLVELEVQAIVSDDCGNEIIRNLSIRDAITGCDENGGPRSISITPNPGSDQIAIQITEKNNKVSVDKYYIYTTDPNGNTTFITESQALSHIINTSSFMNGTHYLHVLVDSNHVTTEQFAILH